ncbi:MAG: acetyl-CoA carboxylase biotin carboxyl carrier protein subunit [Gammaproteobacteria bacterium]|nr:acetyl-CoA carboxylase biotin carboxyl carrier protein subunit [Gammaproteobacteria bacterium]HBW84161.1 acetyl-CoA carboxylase biotin carboxyl carrier protein subunit [Gammaproteobacteria bacterium]|tara:strand:- start:3378 stop:3602 length:225 start_codon:yes stop_codon:yes gene_type:complete
MTKVALETAGSVWKILINVGDFVNIGTTMFILEVMKMEVPYEAPKKGKVVAIYIKEGDLVEEEQIAVEIEDTEG